MKWAGAAARVYSAPRFVDFARVIWLYQQRGANCDVGHRCGENSHPWYSLCTSMLMFCPSSVKGETIHSQLLKRSGSGSFSDVWITPQRGSLVGSVPLTAVPFRVPPVRRLV